MNEMNPPCPGPWRARPNYSGMSIVDRDYKQVAFVRPRIGHWNVGCITLAPQILGAAVELMRNPNDHQKMYDLIRLAVGTDNDPLGLALSLTEEH